MALLWSRMVCTAHSVALSAKSCVFLSFALVTRAPRGTTFVLHFTFQRQPRQKPPGNTPVVPRFFAFPEVCRRHAALGGQVVHRGALAVWDRCETASEPGRYGRPAGAAADAGGISVRTARRRRGDGWRDARRGRAGLRLGR